VSILYAQRRFATAQVIYNVNGGYARYDIPIKLKSTLVVKPRGIENIVSGYGYFENIKKVVSDVYSQKPVKEDNKIIGKSDVKQVDAKPVEKIEIKLVDNTKDSENLKEVDTEKKGLDPLHNKYV
jgi:hypothetical protein